MKKLIAALVFVQFFYSMPALASITLDQYGYEQRIQLSPIAKDTSVGVTLPMEALQQINDKFSNLHLVNARNEDVPFELFYQPQDMVTSIERVTVSSIKEGNDPSHLFDNDRLTEFAFDERVDGAEASTMLVDFGESIDIHRIQFWTTLRAQIRGMQVRLGTDQNRLKTVKSERAFEKIIDGKFPLARFVEISLWGPSVKLEDVLFFTRQKAEIYFTAEPGMSYRLLYGNPEIEFYQFKGRTEVPRQTEIQPELGKMTFNRLASTDIDNDGIDNVDDNCPMVANGGQKDTDEDGFGDVCDNAPKRKNYDQSDVDRDGIADLIDNCKIKDNPGQYDKDKDGTGDACDAGDNTGAQQEAQIETVKSGLTSPLLWGGLLFLLAVAAGAWYMTKRKA